VTLESLESALERTVAENTARFRSINRRGGPTGPVPRTRHLATEGIVDFHSRRAITRTVRRNSGVIRRLAKRWTEDVTIYLLFDGPKLSGCVLGHWQEPSPKWPADLPRQPIGLTFLDLMRHESLVDAIEQNHQNVRGEHTTHYALKLDVNRLTWPEPDRSAAAAIDDSRLARLAIKTLPDPRPKGILPAEIWLDERGRLVRFSYRAIRARTQDKALWPTTELWDFSVPPQLQDWEHQPVIDPSTLQFPESEREMMRLRNTKHKQ
jgi:hypothetical protein